MTEGAVGTPQGAVISPLLANIHLHYVYDLWVDRRHRHDAVRSHESGGLFRMGLCATRIERRAMLLDILPITYI